MKNAAYAWRQGIYFLSLCARQEQERIVGDIRAAAPDQPAGLQPALDELGYSISGGVFDAHGRAPGPTGRQRFLGWSAGPHWILAE